MVNFSSLLDIAYGGVDFSLPGNGGTECVAFLSLKQRIIETITYELLTAVVLWNVRKRLSVPEELQPSREGSGLGKRLLLVLLCLTFGIEIGFKLATRQVIFLLNPCHVLSALQIFLLIAPPSKFVLGVFRVHIYLLFGALLAIALPVLNTRLLPLEVFVYWVQHILILIVVPYYLITCKGPYTLEPLGDFSWATLTYTFFSIYMLLVLQFLGMVSQVNLNNMICPAVSDPFHGPYYRIIGCCHQPLLIFLYGKLNCFLGHKLVEYLDRPVKGD